MFLKDWILENIANPTYDISDLVSLGSVNTDNTQFLSKEQYKKFDFIKELFKDDQGNFSEQAFDNYYDQLAERWKLLQDNSFPTGLSLDPFDTAARKPRAKVRDLGIELGDDFNPNRVKKGIEGFRTISDPTKSISELAQLSKIWDYEKQEYRDDTPEDSTLFGNPIKWALSLFEEPLVLAQYEEDTVDEFGNEHAKGEYKLNNQGTYYYETLAGRSPIGKQVLSMADILTKENSALNEIDFFDSDDIKKSPAGVIAKNIALIAPMFTPAAPYYYTALIAKELTTTLPMLHSIITDTFGDSDSEAPKWLNNLAAKGEQLSTSTSMWSKEHTFSFENLANLISEVALQWGQQKQIVKAVNYFGGGKAALKSAEDKAFKYYKNKKQLDEFKNFGALSDDNWKESILGLKSLEIFYNPLKKSLEQKLKFGADLALAYMALVSNTDVYATMKEKGATDKEAAWVALGSTLGMYGVDKFLHLGEIFYDDLTDDAIKQSRKLLKNEFNEVREKLEYLTTETPLKWFNIGINYGKKAAQTFVENLKDHSLGLVGKSFGEALEEVSEEAVADLSKGIYSLLGDLGMYEASVLNPIDWDTAVERYGMSFVGGAVGGGLFYGVEKYNGYDRHRDKDMLELIRDNKADILRKIVKEEGSKGKAGSSKLSGTKYHRDSESKEVTWLSTEKELDSQNLAVVNKVLEKINSLEAILVGNNAKLNDDLLFKKMVMDEARYQMYKNASYITGYYDEFSKRLDNIVTAESNLRLANETIDGTVKGDKATDELKRELKGDPLALRNKNLLILQATIDQAKLELDLFLSGDSSLDYTRKLNFALDPVLHTAFIPELDYTKWFLENYGLPTDLTPQQKIEIHQKWNDHVKEIMPKRLDEAFLAYKAVEKVISPEMLALQDFGKTFLKTFLALQGLYKDSADLKTFLEKKPLYNMDSRLPDENGIEESDDVYEARKDISTPDAILRYLLRKQRIWDLNNQVLLEYVQQFDNILRGVGYTIDAATNRRLIQNISLVFKDILNRELEYPFIVLGGTFDNTLYKNILLELKPDLSNIDHIAKQLEQLYYTQIKLTAIQTLADFNKKIPAVNKLRNVTNTADFLSIISNIKKSGIENSEELIEALKTKKRSLSGLTGDEYNQALAELLAMIPEGMESSLLSVSTILKNFITKNIGEYLVVADDSLTDEAIKDRIGYNLSFLDFLNLMNDPESLVFQYFAGYNESLPQLVYDLMVEASKIFGGDAPIAVLTENDMLNLLGPTLQRQMDTVVNYADFIKNRIEKNPLYAFQNKLKVETHSPLENIFNTVSKQLSDNPTDVSNINYILNLVYTDYVTADKNDKFLLNDTLEKQLDNAEKVLDLVKAYVYAASINLGKDAYFGLNKTINEFARNHLKDLTVKWEDLPEIDSDYAQVLELEIQGLKKEISVWKAIHANNTMNKLGRLIESESVLNELRYNLSKGLSFKFTVDEKEYDVAEGLDVIPSFDKLDRTSQLATLKEFEQTLYNNWNKIKEESGLSDEELFEKSGFLEKIIVGTDDIKKLKTSKISENLKSLSNYDKALYLLSVISDDPNDYYQSVIDFTKQYDNIAPLPVLLAGARLGESAHTETYKIGFKKLAKIINPNRTILANTVHLNGVAGAGKTEVQLKHIRNRYSDLKALVIGPTSSQATKLQNSLNESKSYTFDETDKNNIFRLMFNDWETIINEFNKAATKLDSMSNKKGGEQVSADYFTLTWNVEDNDSARTIITLNPDKIKISNKFNELLIFVDEAAHLSAFQLALLDLYADKVKGTVFAASDSSQSGYHKNRIENLNPSATFMTRVPKLTESLRSSNILKLYNNSKVESLIDTAEDLVNSGDEAAWKSFANKLPKLINNLNLRTYNKEDGINGDIIGADLNEVIKNLPKDVELGFIGSADSAVYKKLKEAGFTKLSTPLSEKIVPGKPFMQGLEFDYVVIDHLDLEDVSKGIPQDYKAVEFLQRFYTLMSRAKIASIFMDDLSHLVGENVLDDIKSEGFNISKEVAMFRDNYTESLDKLEIKSTKEKKSKKKINKSEEETTIEYLEEETKESINSEIVKNKKELKENLNEHKEDAEVGLDIDNVLEDLIVETTKVLPITGLLESYVNEDGSPRKYSKWLVPEKGKVRRNLAALFTGDKPITKLKDKLKLLDILSSIQSAVIFGGDIKSPELSSILTFKKAWENRKIQLEFRKLTDSDNLGVGADSKYFHPITLNGEKYIVSLVCRLDGLIRSVYEEPFSAIFDISILNTPEFIDSKETKDNIKNNINKKIAEGKIKDVAKAEQFRDNLDKAIKEYVNFLYLVLSEHPDGFVMDLDPSMYESHKTTRLVHRVTPRRLGGTLAVATVENGILDEDGNYAEDYNNFMDTDKRKVVSPVYIVGNKSDLLEGKISESILGKAVVFVSSNTNLSPDELPEKYINQKLDPDSHTPEVRMVVLNNHGLSFNELVTHRIQKQFGGDKPWRMDVLGMRMFTAMWNFRAALENFLEALKVFDDYSEEQLENITKAEREIFEGKNVDEVLSKYSITQKDLEDLNNFNLNLAKDIPIFRLGTGEYIRPFDVSNSSVYGKKQVNLLTLSRAKAKLYHSLLSIILELLTANRPPEEFINMGLEYIPMNTRIVKPDGTDFDTNQYIGNDKRTLSGLIKTSNKTTTISELDESGKVITKASFNPEAIFSFFPKAIGAIASRSRIYQTNSITSDLLSISTIDANDITGKFNFLLGPLFGKGLLQRNGSDNTLFDLFSLIFHGTKESIESDHAYTEEAPFKYGFFIDPDLEVSKEYDNLNVRGEDGKNYTFLRSNTHPAYFDVDVDVIPGGFALHINKIKDTYQGKAIKPIKPVKESEESNNEKPKIGYSYSVPESEAKPFRNFLLNKGLEDTQENYLLFMRTVSKANIRLFFDNKIEIQNITNLINTEFSKDYTDVVIDGNRFLYYRGDSYGELKVDLTDWIIQEFPISTDTNNARFTDMVKSVEGDDIMTHLEFINTISDKFEDSFIEELTNASDINAYLESIISNYNRLLNDYIGTISDEEAIKWNLIDYLDSINNDSNNC